jgi:hypothetical protein
VLMPPLAVTARHGRHLLMCRRLTAVNLGGTAGSGMVPVLLSDGEPLVLTSWRARVR